MTLDIAVGHLSACIYQIFFESEISKMTYKRNLQLIIFFLHVAVLRIQRKMVKADSIHQIKITHGTQLQTHLLRNISESILLEK